MHRIVTIVEHCARILGKGHFSFGKRLSILKAYLFIVLKRFARGRLNVSFSSRRERFLHFDIELDDFRDDFYWIFTEIFVDEGYYFEAEHDDPFILDCGANIGLSVLYFKALYPRARIIAFEPSPDNVKILRRNLERNSISDVKVVETALGATEGNATIFTHGPASTMYEDFAGMQKSKTTRSGKRVVVPVTKLSNSIDRDVDFLKLDVEGAEGEILEDLNCSGKLKQVKALAMEYHQFSREKNKLSTVAGILERNNFDHLAGTGSHNMAEAAKSKYKVFMIFAARTSK